MALYIAYSALVQVMVCCSLGTKPFPEPMLTHCQFETRAKTSLKFQSKYIFIQEHTFKNF